MKPQETPESALGTPPPPFRNQNPPRRLSTRPTPPGSADHEYGTVVPSHPPEPIPRLLRALVPDSTATCRPAALAPRPTQCPGVHPGHPGFQSSRGQCLKSVFGRFGYGTNRATGRRLLPLHSRRGLGWGWLPRLATKPGSHHAVQSRAAPSSYPTTEDQDEARPRLAITISCPVSGTSLIKPRHFALNSVAVIVRADPCKHLDTPSQ